MVVGKKATARPVVLRALLSFLFSAAATIGCNSADKEVIDFADASLEYFGCEQECKLEILSPCTCAPDDPCGWQNDSICDRKCLFNDIVKEMFDDAADCPGACDGACFARDYTACSCAADDPCGWASDGDCDIFCIDNNLVDEMFDDDTDCGPQ